MLALSRVYYHLFDGDSNKLREFLLNFQEDFGQIMYFDNNWGKKGDFIVLNGNHISLVKDEDVIIIYRTKKNKIKLDIIKYDAFRKWYEDCV